MNPSLQLSSAETPGDLIRLRAWLASRGAAALGTLDRHLARPRYRPAFTRIAEHDGQLAGYKHEGFWQCMDTLRDKQGLERLWLAGAPPWKRW